MSKQLPSNPNLEQLKNQAKDLLKAHRSGETEACERIQASFPKLSKASIEEIRQAEFSLRDAQLVIAREYGFPSWPKLKHHQQEGEAMKEQKKQEEVQSEEAPTVAELVNSLIVEALSARASDIHIDPMKEHSRIRLRIDGALREIRQIPSEQHLSIVSQLKIMGHMNIDEKRLPQDGRIYIRVGEREFDLRAATYPSLYGESVVLRVLDKSRVFHTLAELEITSETHKSFYDALHLPSGLILITGPTGHGKSTTLYAALNEIDTPSVKVYTVEDPIKIELPNAIQGSVNPDIGLTTARMLRAISRQNPDVILVNSVLRDKETIDIAIEAALTRHLVLSIMHANDAPSTLTRLLDLGADPFLIPSAVKLVLAQRLVKTLCSQCKKALEPSEQLRQAFVECHIEVPAEVYRAIGCESCGSGYKGRTAVHEMLVMNEELGELVLKHASAEEIRAAARKGGMRTLLENGMEKVAVGVTSVEEVRRVCRQT